MQSDRFERDSLGEVRVPAHALWGAQTQRAVMNFKLGGGRMPARFIHSLASIKACAAVVNAELGLLDAVRAQAIESSAWRVARGEFDDQFPVDVFQTGSGTSTNMNLNEVIATLATRAGTPIHPNDHVNLGQSSNDAIPSAARLAALAAYRDELLPSLSALIETIERRAQALDSIAKTGRTHLMDAMPLTFGQELRGWRAMFERTRDSLSGRVSELCRLPLGGTAVGTGINTDARFAARVCARLSTLWRMPITPMPQPAEGMASQDGMLRLSGDLRVLAVTLAKVSTDLRWMASGPLSGLAEIGLPAVQPGSSIMPGKVNPVLLEAIGMASMQIQANDAAIALAAQNSPFQLNLAMPLAATRALDSIGLASRCADSLAADAIEAFEPRVDRIRQTLARNPILVTALAPVIGYEAASLIAKESYASGRAIIDVARERCPLSQERLEELLDPRRLSDGGIADESAGARSSAASVPLPRSV